VRASIGTADATNDEPDGSDPHEPGMPCAGCQHHDGEPHRMMMQDNADIAAALAACEHLVPEDAGDGRFEIEVTVRGQADGLGNAIEGVAVTRGRKLPCVDADAALEDADEPDVARFDAVAACIEQSLAPTFVDALPDGTTQAMLEVLRDDARAPKSDAPPLPKASAAIDGVDPQESIEHFDLAGRGKADAPVSIVECGGYDCSYCNRARQTTDELADRYGDAIALHYLQMPLGMHPTGELTARAAVAAGLQGKFWAMHDALFDDATLRNEAGIVARAVELGMDGERFARDLAAASTAQAVADQRQVCMAAGAEGTPAFFINGDLVTGAQDISAFMSIIDDELAERRAK
jgi:2-hydroxychromene-2-carboxylate isomerase